MKSDETASSGPLMKIEAAAAYLGYTVGTLYNKVAAGEVPHIRLGRAIRFRRSDLDAWIDEQAAVVEAV